MEEMNGMKQREKKNGERELRNKRVIFENLVNIGAIHVQIACSRTLSLAARGIVRIV